MMLTEESCCVILSGIGEGFDRGPVEGPLGDAGELNKLPKVRLFDIDQPPKNLGLGIRGLKRATVVSNLQMLFKVQAMVTFARLLRTCWGSRNLELCGNWGLHSGCCCVGRGCGSGFSWINKNDVQEE